jgi:hypothetical protein
MTAVLESYSPMDNSVDNDDEMFYTPTDHPVEAVKPMAPARIKNHARTFVYESPNSAFSSCYDDDGTEDVFIPSNKTKRVLLWGTAGGADGYGGDCGDGYDDGHAEDAQDAGGV